MQPALFSKQVFNDPLYRGIYALPFADKFFDLLQDHLHTVVENILSEGNNRFSIFLNVASRKENLILPRSESPVLMYMGCDRQRELLDTSFPNKKNLDELWHKIKTKDVKKDSSKITAGLYDEIINGKYGLDDIQQIYTLKKYFSGELNELQTIEKEIIGEYFDLEKDVFLAIPVIGFGELDGIAYIIFEEQLLDKLPWKWVIKEQKDTSQKSEEVMLLDRSLTWTLCRAFVTEYDGMFLDWNNVGDDMEKIAAVEHLITQTILSGDDYFNQKVKNPIYKELDLRNYYLRHREYYIERLRLASNIPGKIYEQYLTNAVTAILVDSYAHNVSAHALSTLSWWYMRRASQLKEEEVDWDTLIDYLRADALIDNGLLDQFMDAIQNRRKTKKLDKKDFSPEKFTDKDGAAVINYPGSLARELAQLLRFITEKGAFWSGVIRDDNVGGKVSSLYSVLWYDFIKNPFYLGTIAKSEDILHIKVKVVIYEDEVGSSFPEPKIVKPFNELDKGVLGGVNLMQPRDLLAEKRPDAKHHDEVSAFVYKGDKFNHLRERLKKIKIYFPGGVVGRHTFFTMIENEIRNIKHYTGSALKKAQDEGLTITIGIQTCNLPESDRQEMYRISLWLEIPTEMQKEGSNKHLVAAKWDLLMADIVDKDTHAPKLGGTYQDKICAAFLLNGVYSHVQRGDENPLRDKSKDALRNQRYYPYIRVGCSEVKSPGKNQHTDYRISYNSLRNQNDEKEIIDTSSFPKVGYLKKMFHVWRGEYLLELNDDQVSSSLMDNLSRFYLVRAKKISEELLTKLRRDLGLVRVVAGLSEEIDEKKRFEQTYKAWLWKLCGGEEELYALDIKDQNQPVHFCALKSDINGELSMHYYADRDDDEPIYKIAQETWKKSKAEEWILKLAHKSTSSESKQPDEIRYRSHGIYKSFFFPDKHIHLEVDDRLVMEFFEVMVTRVCIFDNRVYQRMRLPENSSTKKEYRTFLRQSLKLAVHNERRRDEETNTGDWKDFLDTEELVFLKCSHFLVMHLSFIESIIKDKYPLLDIVEKTNVAQFIQEEILPLTGERDNFFFVVTTGRGRNDWWASLKSDAENKASTFALFRPVESLLSAVENSMGMHDDIELKYRIVKYLYGS